ncbi:MAG TPA: hypothetical protein VLY84_07085, partial [Dysgonamonadaceae bacterium]|nr:hypothetical protein [Dysgonamonadaceae bacterium]
SHYSHPHITLPLTPYSLLLTLYSLLFTPYSLLLTPHSSPLTPYPLTLISKSNAQLRDHSIQFVI